LTVLSVTPNQEKFLKNLRLAAIARWYRAPAEYSIAMLKEKFSSFMLSVLSESYEISFSRIAMSAAINKSGLRTAYSGRSLRRYASGYRA